MNSLYFCPSCSSETQHIEIKKHYSSEFNQEFSIMQCEKCMTLMTHPFLTNKQLDDYYVNEAINGEGKYNKWRKKYKYIHDWINKTLNLKNLVVVEIGSNSGNLLRYFREASHCNVTGIELSEKCKEYSENVNNVRVYGGELSDFTKENNFKADLLLMIHTFEHIPDPIGLLHQIDNVITDNGHLYIEIPNGRMKEFELTADIANPLCIPFHAYLYNMDSLCNLLTHNGYSIESRRYYSRKEDGGSITNAYVLYTQDKIKQYMGDNVLSKSLSILAKLLIRFYPNRALLGYLFSKNNKSSSIAVLCRKISRIN